MSSKRNDQLIVVGRCKKHSSPHQMSYVAGNRVMRWLDFTLRSHAPGDRSDWGATFSMKRESIDGSVFITFSSTGATPKCWANVEMNNGNCEVRKVTLPARRGQVCLSSRRHEAVAMLSR